jgi:Spy/CpxP family protein refolding chaperone
MYIISTKPKRRKISMKKTIGMSILALALGSVFVAPVFAAEAPVPPAPSVAQSGDMPPPPSLGGGHEHGGGHKGGPRGGFDGGPFKNLNLTADQKAKIQEIHKAHRDTERAEIDKVLTPEQQAQLQQNKAEHEAKFGKGERPPAPPSK